MICKCIQCEITYDVTNIPSKDMADYKTNYICSKCQKQAILTAKNRMNDTDFYPQSDAVTERLRNTSNRIKELIDSKDIVGGQ